MDRTNYELIPTRRTKNVGPKRAHSSTARRNRIGRNRRLTIEPLEARNMLSITVNTLVDEDNGIGMGAGTSLREALAAATAGETIDFSVTGTINLTLGQLVIDKELTISGPGAQLLAIDASGNDSTPAEKDGLGTRVFTILDSQNTAPVVIGDLTLTGGDDGEGVGGAVYSSDDLTIENSIIIGNATNGSGGGIHADNGILTVRSTTIFDNQAQFSGGGISSGLFGPSAIAISDSTIANNIVVDSSFGLGGGIYYEVLPSAGEAELHVLRSTVADNSGPRRGGGVFVVDLAIANIRDSTISGNTSAEDGGGVFATSATSGTMRMENTTLSRNVASDEGGGAYLAVQSLLRNVTVTLNESQTGGGFHSDSSVLLMNTIVSDNTNIGGTSPNNISDMHPIDASSAYNLVGTNGNGNLSSNLRNIIGVDDPGLGPLQNNGGPTQTHLPQVGSPAIDVGPLAAAYGTIEFDQRGDGFSRVLNGRIDIGAIETAGPVINPPPPSDLSIFALNLDFEEYVALPTGPSEMFYADETVVGWRQLHEGTSDYFNANSFLGSGQIGMAPLPIDGSDGFIGLLYDEVSGPVNQPWYEYGMQILPVPLVPDQEYILNLFTGTTSGNEFGGEFVGDFVVYGIPDVLLIPESRTFYPFDGNDPPIEEWAAGNNVELLSIPVNQPASTWISHLAQSFTPMVPIEAIVFGIRTDAEQGYLLVDASQATPLPEISGDYNRNGVVDAADYVIWRKTLNSTTTPFSGADGNGNGTIDPPDYDVWTANFGATSGSGASSSQLTYPVSNVDAADSYLDAVVDGFIAPQNAPAISFPLRRAVPFIAQDARVQAVDTMLATLEYEMKLRRIGQHSSSGVDSHWSMSEYELEFGNGSLNNLYDWNHSLSTLYDDVLEALLPEQHLVRFRT